MSAGNEQAGAVQIADTELNDEMVREYLKLNDDFLERNPDMLDYLHIAHASGSAISLVEKQVSVLRERNMDMRHRLNSLTTHARENDRLYEQTRNLVLKLLEAGSVAELYAAFMTAMSGDFGVEHACMILYGDGGGEGFREESRDTVKARIGPLIRSSKGVSGTLRAEELKFLFPDGSEVGSAALMPLSGGGQLGLIAVGSSDANRYHSSVGTLFLAHIADVIVRLLPRLSPDGR